MVMKSALPKLSLIPHTSLIRITLWPGCEFNIDLNPADPNLILILTLILSTVVYPILDSVSMFKPDLGGTLTAKPTSSMRLIANYTP